MSESKARIKTLDFLQHIQTAAIWQQVVKRVRWRVCTFVSQRKQEHPFPSTYQPKHVST
jgi:hypothetical protein